VSDFGLRLKAKQKLKNYYGNSPAKQFLRTYDEAARRERLRRTTDRACWKPATDAIYRAKFVPTVWARAFVNRGHVTVNGRRSTSPPYRVRADDVVEVRSRATLALVL
jgi:small subunit ribosomal protein S4